MLRVGLFHLRLEEDGPQTERTMVPATFTKHLATIAANVTKRKKLEEESRVTQGKEGAHNISRKRKVYNGNFQLILFFGDSPLKLWPYRSANLILVTSIFICTRPNPRPDMCIFFSLLLLYQFLGVFTFHDSVMSVPLK